MLFAKTDETIEEYLRRIEINPEILMKILNWEKDAEKWYDAVNDEIEGCSRDRWNQAVNDRLIVERLTSKISELDTFIKSFNIKILFDDRYRKKNYSFQDMHKTVRLNLKNILNEVNGD